MFGDSVQRSKKMRQIVISAFHELKSIVRDGLISVIWRRNPD